MRLIPVPRNDDELLEEYPGPVRIVSYLPRDGIGTDPDPDADRRYRVEYPDAETIPSFDSPDAARLWVDVWFDVDGFDPTDVGSRGIPPSVALAGTDTLAAYLLTRNGMKTDRVAQFLDVSRTTVHAYTSRVRGRARDRREELQTTDRSN